MSRKYDRENLNNNELICLFDAAIRSFLNGHPWRFAAVIVLFFVAALAYLTTEGG
jgi:hypothetical protein